MFSGMSGILRAPTVTSPRTIQDGIPLGRYTDVGSVYHAYAHLADRNLFIIGWHGSGKTATLQTVIDGLLTCKNTETWVISTSGPHLLDQQVVHRSTTDKVEACEMLEAATVLIRTRQETAAQGSIKQVVIVVDEWGDLDYPSRVRLEWINEHGPAVGVSLVLAVTYFHGGLLKKMVRDAARLDLRPDDRPDRNFPGAGLYRHSSARDPRPVKVYLTQQTELVPDANTADTAGDRGVINPLAGFESGTANPTRVAEALRCGTEAAAVDILIAACDGALLAMPSVQRCMRRDGFRLSVCWPLLRNEVDSWRGTRCHGNREIAAPVAQAIVAVAAAIREHLLTPAELAAVRHAIAATGH